MGHAASKELLIERWNALIDDPSYADLPFKVELDENGDVQMSPANNWHAMRQVEIAARLRAALPHGTCFGECSTLTEIGVRVADAAWASPEFMAAQGLETPFLRAPEIVVEVVSPSNTPREIESKVNAYLRAGAHEVWIVDQDTGIAVYGEEGRRSASRYGVPLD